MGGEGRGRGWRRRWEHLPWSRCTTNTTRPLPTGKVCLSLLGTWEGAMGGIHQALVMAPLQLFPPPSPLPPPSLPPALRLSSQARCACCC